MADVSGMFDKLKTFADYQRAEEEFQFTKDLAQAKLIAAQRGADLPAALQIANEIGVARKSGDTARLNDLIMSGKLMDKGVVWDGSYGQPVSNEQLMPIPSNVDELPPIAPSAGMLPQLPDLQNKYPNAPQMGGFDLAQIEGAVENTPAGKAGLSVTVPPSGRGVTTIPGYGQALAGMAAQKKGAETQAQKDVELSMNPRITSAEEIAKIKAGQVGDQSTMAGDTGVALSAFEELMKVSQKAPSGAIDAFGSFVSSKTKSPSEKAIALGEFDSARGAAESMIRKTFRVVGSGADTERDAKPLIDMLPSANDATEVKIAKIQRTMQTLQNRAAELSAARGLPNPFEGYAPNQAPSMPKGGAGEIEFNLTKKGFTPEQIKEYMAARGLK